MCSPPARTPCAHRASRPGRIAWIAYDPHAHGLLQCQFGFFVLADLLHVLPCVLPKRRRLAIREAVQGVRVLDAPVIWPEGEEDLIELNSLAMAKGVHQLLQMRVQQANEIEFGSLYCDRPQMRLAIAEERPARSARRRPAQQRGVAVAVEAELKPQ